MDLLQVREKEIFETLKKIKNSQFAVIGGYAINAYTLPRFSVDCDIVVKEDAELKEIEIELKKRNYVKKDADKVSTPYHGEFVRYEKELKKNFKVSMDILFKDILDRQTNSSFSAEWVFKNSKTMLLKGKTITEELNLRIINIDALIVMKWVSCRIVDIRDVFMLITQAKDKKWIKQEIGKRCNFKERFEKIKSKISSAEFKDNLQGVYGYIDNNLFKKYKESLSEFIRV